MNLLKVCDVSFSYKNKAVLNNISLNLDERDILSLLGPNGSGKTTLLNCIIRFLTDYSGDILIGGTDTRLLSSKELASFIAYVPQLSSISFDYTVKEFVVMGRSPHLNFLDKPAKKDYMSVDEKLDLLDVSHLCERNFEELSGGEKQLVYIARALVQSPKIIILDEPTSALDYGNSIKVLKIIKRLSETGYTIIMTCHNPEYPFLLGGKTAAIFNNKEFVFGDTGKVVTSELLTRLYGIPIRLEYLQNYNKHVCIWEN